MSVRYRIKVPDCVACAVCVEVCPLAAIIEAGQIYRIKPETCNGCGDCAQVCPTEAIEVFDWEEEQPPIITPMFLSLRLYLGEN